MCDLRTHVTCVTAEVSKPVAVVAAVAGPIRPIVVLSTALGFSFRLSTLRFALTRTSAHSSLDTCACTSL